MAGKLAWIEQLDPRPSLDTERVKSPAKNDGSACPANWRRLPARLYQQSLKY
jgi:hypothetical protein